MHFENVHIKQMVVMNPNPETDLLANLPLSFKNAECEKIIFMDPVSRKETLGSNTSLVTCLKPKLIPQGETFDGEFPLRFSLFSDFKFIHVISLSKYLSS